jgi:hypothetical protein
MLVLYMFVISVYHMLVLKKKQFICRRLLKRESVESRIDITSYKRKATDSEQSDDSRQQVEDSRQQTANSLQRTADSGHQIADIA